MKFETIALHGGQTIDQDTLSRAVPIYRTSAYVFKNTEHAANLFALKELGMLRKDLLQRPENRRGLDSRIERIQPGMRVDALVGV